MCLKDDQPNLEAWLIVKCSLNDFIQPSLSLITDCNHKPVLFTVKGICSYFSTDFQWHKNTFVTYNHTKQKVFPYFFSSNCFLSPDWRISDVCSELVCLFDLKNLENVRKNWLHGFPGDVFKELVLSDIQKVKTLPLKKVEKNLMNLRNVLVSQRYYLFISCTAFFSIILIQRNRITSCLLFIYLFFTRKPWWAYPPAL